MDLWPITIQARRSLLSTFEQLDDAQWDVGSLCDGWTIRQVLAHLTLAARPPALRYAKAVARAKGDFNKANHSLAVDDAERPTSTLLSAYRRVIDHRFSPPGWPQAAPLSDIMVHSLDVRIPLGLETAAPADHYEPVLGLLFGPFGRSFTSKGRPAVRWVAVDHQWSHGNGPDVRGTMADLALTAAGRGARVPHLDGDGVAIIEDWLRPRRRSVVSAPPPERYEFCLIYVQEHDEIHVASLLPRPSEGVEVDVSRSDDWTRRTETDDFTLWPTYIEIYQDEGAIDRGIVAAVQAVLDRLNDAGILAVAAADFEDELCDGDR